jgi:hypothetical protein
MKTPVLLVLLASLHLLPAYGAESTDEVLVTAGRTDKTVIPGVSLRRTADFALQRLKVSSDAPELNSRRDDILATLRLLQAAATRDKAIELCVLLDGRAVVPLKVDASTLRFVAGSRAQTSEVFLAAKARVTAGAGNANALFARLKEFPATVKPAGRAAIDVIGDAELTLENPEQYRAKVIDLYAADSRAVTAALGTEYRVVTRGIDRQLQWLRDGLSDVVIYIPYEYDVIPVNISSYSRAP